MNEAWLPEVNEFNAPFLRELEKVGCDYSDVEDVVVGRFHGSKNANIAVRTAWNGRTHQVRELYIAMRYFGGSTTRDMKAVYRFVLLKSICLRVFVCLQT